MMHSYPWYMADWLESRTRAEMTLPERALYRDTLDLCYRNGSIPDNKRALCGLLSCTAEEFDESWPAVRSRLIELENGDLTHQRVQDELPRLLDLKEHRKKRGSGAARVRWERQRAKLEQSAGIGSDAPSISQACSKHASSNAPSIAQASVKQCNEHRSSIDLASLKQCSSNAQKCYTSTSASTSASITPCSPSCENMFGEEQPQPKEKRRKAAGTDQQQGWFREYMSRHPKPDIQTSNSEQLFMKAVKTDEVFRYIIDDLEKAITRDGQYILGPWKFLRESLKRRELGIRSKPADQPVQRPVFDGRNPLAEYVPISERLARQ